MRSHVGKKLFAAALLAATLAGCGTPVAQQPAPTAAPTIAPTAAPTVAPSVAPTVAPTAAPAQVKLPALDSGQWAELGRGPFVENGVLTRVLYLPSTVPGNTDFAANYAPEQVAVAEAVVMVQESAGSPLIVLHADRAGVSGDVLLWRSSESSPPAAYMVALDPGSSFLLNLLPIDARGMPIDRAIPLNWSDAAGALRVVPVPTP